MQVELSLAPSWMVKADGEQETLKVGTGGPPQPGMLKTPTRVRQGALPVVARYSLVYQKVQSSAGSSSMEE